MPSRPDGPAPIDPRGPRTNQAVLAVGLVLGLLTGQSWVVPLFAVVLLPGAALGPRYGPVLRLYAAVIRPHLAPPTELEDPRPPRFAAGVGVVFLALATLALALGATVVGWGLAVVVAVLAGLSAVTGLCVGCEIYVALVRLRGGVRVVRVDRSAHGGTGTPRPTTGGGAATLPGELRRGGPQWLVFSTRYCAACPSVVADIRRRHPDEHLDVLDVADHLDLASRFAVRRAPTVLRVDADGRVVARLAGADAVRAALGDEPVGV